MSSSSNFSLPRPPPSHPHALQARRKSKERERERAISSSSSSGGRPSFSFQDDGDEDGEEDGERSSNSFDQPAHPRSLGSSPNPNPFNLNPVSSSSSSTTNLNNLRLRSKSGASVLRGKISDFSERATSAANTFKNPPPPSHPTTSNQSDLNSNSFNSYSSSSNYTDPSNSHSPSPNSLAGKLVAAGKEFKRTRERSDSGRSVSAATAPGAGSSSSPNPKFNSSLDFNSTGSNFNFNNLGGNFNPSPFNGSGNGPGTPPGGSGQFNYATYTPGSRSRAGSKTWGSGGGNVTGNGSTTSGSPLNSPPISLSGGGPSGFNFGHTSSPTSSSSSPPSSRRASGPENNTPLVSLQEADPDDSDAVFSNQRTPSPMKDFRFPPPSPSTSPPPSTSPSATTFHNRDPYPSDVAENSTKPKLSPNRPGDGLRPPPSPTTSPQGSSFSVGSSSSVLLRQPVTATPSQYPELVLRPATPAASIKSSASASGHDGVENANPIPPTSTTTNSSTERVSVFGGDSGIGTSKVEMGPDPYLPGEEDDEEEEEGDTESKLGGNHVDKEGSSEVAEEGRQLRVTTDGVGGQHHSTSHARSGTPYSFSSSASSSPTGSSSYLRPETGDDEDDDDADELLSPFLDGASIDEQVFHFPGDDVNTPTTRKRRWLQRNKDKKEYLDIKEALEGLERVEAKQWLERKGKKIKEFHVGKSDATVKKDWKPPNKGDYEIANGKGQLMTNWPAFLEAYAVNVIDYYLPPAILIPNEGPQPLKVSVMREQMERIYVSCPKDVWIWLMDGRARRFWMWEDPLLTGKWAGTYFILWWYDIILAFPFILIIYALLRVHFFPPPASVVLEAAKHRAQRGKEARALSNDLKKREKVQSAVVKSLGPTAGVAVGLGLGALGDLGDHLRLPHAHSPDEGSHMDGLLGKETPKWKKISRQSLQLVTGKSPSPSHSRSPSSLGGLKALMLPTAVGLSHSSEVLQPDASSIAPMNSSTSLAPSGRVSVETVHSSATPGRSSTSLPDADESEDQKTAQGRHRSQSTATTADGDDGERKGSKKSADPNHQSSASITSLYKLSLELKSKAGPGIQMLIEDAADWGERARNVALWRNPEATWRSVALLGICFLFLLFAPTKYIYKLIWGWVGLEVFVVFALMDRHPRLRHAAHPWWWLVLGSPNDAEWAIQVLNRQLSNPSATPTHKSSLGASSKGSRKERIKRHLHTQSVPSSSPTSIRAALVNGGAMATTTALRGRAFMEEDPNAVRRGAFGDANPPRSPGAESLLIPMYEESPVRDRAASESFFCFYLSSPGTLQIFSDSLQFDANKKFKSVTNLLKKGKDALEGSKDSLPKSTKTLVRVSFNDISTIQKAKIGKIVGARGLVVKLTNNKSLVFTMLQHRDETFLALSAAVGRGIDEEIDLV